MNLATVLALITTLEITFRDQEGITIVEKKLATLKSTKLDFSSDYAGI
jgi:hypothetical protein